jgi:HB1, ASXL, restriction endonuclease HTH domain
MHKRAKPMGAREALAREGRMRRKEREQMAATPKQKKSGKAAAIEVLRKNGKAMTIKEVVAAALDDPQVTGLQGRTPAATLSAALYTEAKKPDGVVVLVGRGMIEARPVSSPPTRSA